MSPPSMSPRILRYLPPDRLIEWENTSDTVAALWPDFTIAYVNPAWRRFALDNGGEPEISRNWSLGACAMDAIAASIRPYYEDRFRQCFVTRQTWRLDYECSSADRFRIVQMRAFPTPGHEALIVIHTTRADFRCVREEGPARESCYRQSDGRLRQCCGCQKFQRCDGSGQWDWVRGWIRQRPADIFETLCESCEIFYFNE